jgi:hypothetical protein
MLYKVSCTVLPPEFGRGEWFICVVKQQMPLIPAGPLRCLHALAASCPQHAAVALPAQLLLPMQPVQQAVLINLEARLSAAH